MRQHKTLSVPFLECAAIILGLDHRVEYSMLKLFQLIESRYFRIVKSTDNKDKKHHIKIIKNMRKSMKQRYGKRDFLGYPPFEYYYVLSRLFSGKKLKAAEKTLELFFPSLPAGLFFIEKAIEKKIEIKEVDTSCI